MRSSAAPQPHWVESRLSGRNTRCEASAPAAQYDVACGTRQSEHWVQPRNRSLEFGLDGGQVSVDGFVEQAGLLLVSQGVRCWRRA